MLLDALKYSEHATIIQRGGDDRVSPVVLVGAEADGGDGGHRLSRGFGARGGEHCW